MYGIVLLITRHTYIHTFPMIVITAHSVHIKLMVDWQRIALDSYFISYLRNDPNAVLLLLNIITVRIRIKNMAVVGNYRTYLEPSSETKTLSLFPQHATTCG